MFFYRFFYSDRTKYLVLTGVFVLFWYFNYCFPLIWDDYVYSYIFHADNFYRPLPDTAQRVTCFKDIFISQWNHYFSWGGRTVAHILVQFFLWKGKPIFSFVNAGCFVLLLLEMQWIIDKGRINFDFTVRDIVWLFGLFWIFSVFCIDVLTWLTVSCNYMWTLAILLFFVLINVYIFFNPNERNVFSNNILLFVLGVLAGWTNENTVCFVILALGCLLIAEKSQKFKDSISKTAYNNLLSGFAGLVLGYLLLILAPGNYARYYISLNDGLISTGFTLLKTNIRMFCLILIVRFLLYYYVISKILSLYAIYDKYDVVDKKYFCASIAFLLLSIGSLIIMIFSPEFRWRSSFSSLIFLLISGGIIRKLASVEVKPNDPGKKLCKVMNLVMSVYVVCTVLFSIFLYSISKLQNNVVMEQIVAERKNPSNQVLLIKERPDFIDNNLFLCFVFTGGHVPYVYTLTQDENYWINRDIALFYGIKGIKGIKRE